MSLFCRQSQAVAHSERHRLDVTSLEQFGCQCLSYSCLSVACNILSGDWTDLTVPSRSQHTPVGFCARP